MSWLSDAISSIFDFIKGLWSKLGILLVIAIVLFVVCAPYLVGVLGAGTAFAASLPAWLSWLPAIVTGFAAYGPLVCAIAGLGLAYLVDSTTVADTIHGVADVVGDTIGTVAGSATAAFTSSSGLSTVLWLAGAGVLAYFLLSSDSKDETSTTTADRSPVPRTATTTQLGVR